jgi:hypothetical protein
VRIPFLTKSRSTKDNDPRILGSLEYVDSREVIGWALDPIRPDSLPVLEIMIGDIRVGLTTPSRPRPDVTKKYNLKGTFGFSFFMSKALKDAEIERVRVLARDFGVELASAQTQRMTAAEHISQSATDSRTDALNAKLAGGLTLDRAEETAGFWMSCPLNDLAQRTASLHTYRREAAEKASNKEVTIARRTVADFFVRGVGIEVGAGDRPFPIPSHARCGYGDIRDIEELKAYFKSSKISIGDLIDAQTFAGIPDGSLDFIISAHVIEHLENPIGSILTGMKKLKCGGTYLLAVPDARYTFDRQRPLTTVDHIMADFEDGGKGTRLESYRDFVRYTAVAEWGEDVAVESIDSEAKKLSDANLDIHFHVWTGETFLRMLNEIINDDEFEIVGTTAVVNENIFVLRRL